MGDEKIKYSALILVISEVMLQEEANEVYQMGNRQSMISMILLWPV